MKQAEIARTIEALRAAREPDGTVPIRPTAAALGISRSTLRKRMRKLQTGEYAGLDFEIKFKANQKPGANQEARDRIGRLEVKARESQSEINRLRKQNAALSEIRESILEIVETKPKPASHKPSKGNTSGGRQVLLHLTDVHKGEVVDLDEMSGVNMYNSEICTKRVGRFFDKAAGLTTTHWSGRPPERIKLAIGGDLISGDIHDELKETNDLGVFQAVRGVAQDIAGGIKLLRNELPDVPVDVYSVPGNHSRLTPKSGAKKYAINNADTLAHQLVEMMLMDDEMVWFSPENKADDVLIQIYNRNIMLAHGDRNGARGGTGFIGPVASITKGHRKMLSDASRNRDVKVNLCLTGHFHSTFDTGIGLAGGSVVGPGEFARMIKADLEPAQQWYTVWHETRGLIDQKKLVLGVESEGSIYKGWA